MILNLPVYTYPLFAGSGFRGVVSEMDTRFNVSAEIETNSDLRLAIANVGALDFDTLISIANEVLTDSDIAYTIKAVARHDTRFNLINALEIDADIRLAVSVDETIDHDILLAIREIETFTN